MHRLFYDRSVDPQNPTAANAGVTLFVDLLRKLYENMTASQLPSSITNWMVPVDVKGQVAIRSEVPPK